MIHHDGEFPRPVLALPARDFRRDTSVLRRAFAPKDRKRAYARECEYGGAQCNERARPNAQKLNFFSHARRMFAVGLIMLQGRRPCTPAGVWGGGGPRAPPGEGHYAPRPRAFI